MPNPALAPDRAALRERLRAEIANRSFGEGAPIRLASGRESTFYFNMKPTMMSPVGAHGIAALMLDAIADDSADFVGGLELGAVPIAAAIAAVSAIEGRPMPGFFVRKAAKEHGTRRLIEGLAPHETLDGKRVVLVEDVTTTGGSALQAAEQVRAEGGIIVRVVTIVDREEGAAEAFAEAGLPFTALFLASAFRSR